MKIGSSNVIKRENAMGKPAIKGYKRYAALVLAAVVGITGAIIAPANAKTVKLTFWSWRVEDKAFYEQVISEFRAANRAHRNIEITFQAYPNADYATILSSAMAAGKGPDIVHVRAYGALDQLVVPKYLSVIKPNEVKGLNTYNKSIVDSMRGFTDKRLFGVPFATQSLGIFSNKDLLRRAGITRDPRTYGEFLENLEKLKRAGIQPLANGGSTHMEQMWGVIAPTFYGGTEYYDAVVKGTKKFTDPAFVRSLSEMEKLFPYMPNNATAVTYDSSRQLFFSGRAAYFMGGIFELGFFKSNNAGLNVDFFGMPPLTAGGKTYVSSWADGGFAVNAKTPHRKEAMLFINYVASKKFGQAFSDTVKQFSTVPGVTILDQTLWKAQRATRAGGTPYIMLVGFRYKNPTGSALLQTGLPNMLNGSKTAAQVANEVQQGVASWYDPLK
jgi:raffinose/stachyose/melibiose transport system substrate-binding protein